MRTSDRGEASVEKLTVTLSSYWSRILYPAEGDHGERADGAGEQGSRSCGGMREHLGQQESFNSMSLCEYQDVTSVAKLRRIDGPRGLLPECFDCGDRGLVKKLSWGDFYDREGGRSTDRVTGELSPSCSRVAASSLCSIASLPLVD